jgi:hypothetical protein
MNTPKWGRKETIIFPPHSPIYSYGAVFFALILTCMFVYAANEGAGKEQDMERDGVVRHSEGLDIHYVQPDRARGAETAA